MHAQQTTLDPAIWPPPLRCMTQARLNRVPPCPPGSRSGSAPAGPHSPGTRRPSTTGVLSAQCYASSAVRLVAAARQRPARATYAGRNALSRGEAGLVNLTFERAPVDLGVIRVVQPGPAGSRTVTAREATGCALSAACPDVSV